MTTITVNSEKQEITSLLSNQYIMLLQNIGNNVVFLEEQTATTNLVNSANSFCVKKWNSNSKYFVYTAPNVITQLSISKAPYQDNGSEPTPGSDIEAGTGLVFDGNVLNHLNNIPSNTVGGPFKIPVISYDAQGHITFTNESLIYKTSTYDIGSDDNMLFTQKGANALYEEVKTMKGVFDFYENSEAVEINNYLLTLNEERNFIAECTNVSNSGELVDLTGQPRLVIFHFRINQDTTNIEWIEQAFNYTNGVLLATRSKQGYTQGISAWRITATKSAQKQSEIEWDSRYINGATSICSLLKSEYIVNFSFELQTVGEIQTNYQLGKFPSGFGASGGRYFFLGYDVTNMTPDLTKIYLFSVDVNRFLNSLSNIPANSRVYVAGMFMTE